VALPSFCLWLWLFAASTDRLRSLFAARLVANFSMSLHTRAKNLPAAAVFYGHVPAPSVLCPLLAFRATRIVLVVFDEVQWPRLLTHSALPAILCTVLAVVTILACMARIGSGAGCRQLQWDLIEQHDGEQNLGNGGDQL
jgi:hypothetical protein